MKEIPFIASLYYKDMLSMLKPALNQIGVRYIAIYFLFPNGERFVLTNHFELSKSYYIEDTYLKDKNLYYETFDHEKPIFPKDIDLFSGYENVLEGRFSTYWNYYKAWKSYDCQIVIGALSNKKRDDNEYFYKISHKRLEKILFSFIDNNIKIFSLQNPNFKGTRILSDSSFRKNLVEGKLSEKERTISDKELMTLYWSALGKTSEEVSIITGASRNSINSYRQSIVEKLNCCNITHAVFEASQRGVFNFIDGTPKTNLVMSNLNSIKKYL